MSGTAKPTPYYEQHLKAGAKMVEFAGYLMPIQYRSINEEHLKVRSSVGIFDLSHMGEFRVSGPGALRFLQKMTVNDVSALQPNQVQYSCMCYPEGGIVDDLLVYHRGDHYYLVVNAACLDKDFAWLESHLERDVRLENLSDDTGLLAIQGPQAEMVMAKLTDFDLSSMPFYWAADHHVIGEQVLFSRTGYTGEDGFEIYHPPHLAGKIWQAALEAGREYDIEPIGLGARDSLRLEMKYMLYGNDIDQTTNPIEAGMSWIVKVEKGDFIGRDAIIRAKEGNLSRRLVAFVLNEKGIPRHGYLIFADGREIGRVTSGIFSPVLQKGIALGYVLREFSKAGTEFEVEIRGKKIPATVVKPPFYKEYTHK